MRRQIFGGILTLALLSIAFVNSSPAQTPHPKLPEEPAKEDPQKEVDDPRDRLPELPAREVMKYARLLHFKARSTWFNADKLERELLKRKEFGDLGLEITREEKYADLVMEITRKVLTTRCTCTMMEPRSKRIVGSTTASSLGGEIEPNLAEAIIKEFKTARAAAATPRH
ncbi:MAG: hypothetical protein HOP19_13100 [Acidobacteria bacterium]|nr:hypothetical protein [Acidobacteriota bacterium]